MSKNLLIIEKNNNAVNVIKQGSDYILSGIFTEFGIKNSNNRIYEETEILPHIEELKAKIKTKSLLGELDHPAGFDISLKNVSHVIESLEYDQTNRRVIGKIRLLDTSAGKEAKALVDAGIPLHISSRAAGVVESDGKVKMRKMFTYDLVATPGFASASLNLVNESYGFSNNGNLFIYEVNDLLPEEEKKSNNNMNENLVTREQLDGYTRDWKKQFDLLKESVLENSSSDDQLDKLQKQLNGLSETVKNVISHNDHLVENVNQTEKRQKDFENYSDSELVETIKTLQTDLNSLKSKIDKVIEHNDHIVENVQLTQSYIDHIVENVNESESKLNKRFEYMDYLAEELNKSIDYSEHIVENVNNLERFGDYLAESLSKSIEFSEHIAENTNNVIEYSEYIAENSNNLEKFGNYLAENLDKSIQYSEKIVEQSNNLEKFVDYLAESLNESIEYSEYLKENVETAHDYLDYLSENINETFKTTEKTEQKTNIVAISENNSNINENNSQNSSKQQYNDLDKKLDSILSVSLKRKETESVKTAFVSHLLEKQRNSFSLMNEEERNNVINTFETRNYNSSREVQMIFEGIVNKVKEENWIELMPNAYRPLWNNLTESQKNIIAKQASMRVLESEVQVENFWKSRDLRSFERTTLFGDKINENVIPTTEEPIQNDPRMKMFEEGMFARFGGPSL